MIYVECTPDAALVRHITDPSKRQVIHELKGKYEVCKRVSSQSDCRAMVDEDPGSVVPPYLRRISLVQELVEEGLIVYHDGARRNQVVVLRPRLEDWILAAAKGVGLMAAAFGLPAHPARLHSVINANISKYNRLLEALDEAGSNRLVTLSRLLS